MQIKEKKVLKIEFENGEIEVLKNICEFTDFFLASACVTGGSGQPYSDEYKKTLKSLISNFSESKGLVDKIRNYNKKGE